MLKTGTKAPDFTLPDQNGTIHTLTEYKGKKLLLYFYPKDNTSGCSAQAEGYALNKNELEKLGITVVGVSKDSVASHKKFESNHSLNFTLLSDADKKVIEAYDVWKEKKLYGKSTMGVVRTTYVINEEGIIVFASDKVKAASDSITMIEEIKKL